MLTTNPLKQFVLLLLLCAVNYPYSTYAKSQLDSISELSLEDLVTVEVDIASTDKKNLQNTPSSVTVISSADLQNYNFLTLAEALETVVGISIYRTYLKRDLLTSRGILQDIYANKTLILINKVPVWNAVTGEGNLERIAVEDIEQIEILKGPASVQYGTNAYSGVVNIVLKQKTAPEAEIKAGHAQYSERKIAANYSCTQGDLLLFASASSNTGNGDPSPFTDENGIDGTVNEYIHTAAATANVSYLDHTVLVNSFRSEESFLGFTPDYASGIGFPHKVEGSMASYQYKHQYSKLGVRIKSSIDVQNRQMSRDAMNSVQASIKGYQTVSGCAVKYDMWPKLNAELGFENYYRKSLEYRNYHAQTGRTVDRLYDSVLFDGENNMQGVSMQENSAIFHLNYTSGNASAVAGCRYTDNSYGGHNISSHLAYLYAITQAQSIKMIYSESYRAPSLFELYFKYPSVLGSSDLKPETCRSLELTYVYSSSMFFVQSLVYWACYHHKIYRKDLSDYPMDGRIIQKITQYQNGETTSAAGAELELSYRNPQICNLFVNIDYTHAIQNENLQNTGANNIAYISKSNISGGIAKSFGIFSASSTLNYYSPSHGQYSSIAAQYVVNIAVGLKHKLWGKYIDHTLYVKNIADQQRMLPEYVRFRSLNEIPSGNGRSFGYSVLLRL